MRTSTPVTASQPVTTRTVCRAHTYRKRSIVRYNLDGKKIEEIEEWQEENICFCCQLIFRILFISQGETLPYIYIYIYF